MRAVHARGGMAVDGKEARGVLGKSSSTAVRLAARLAAAGHASTGGSACSQVARRSRGVTIPAGKRVCTGTPFAPGRRSAGILRRRRGDAPRAGHIALQHLGDAADHAHHARCPVGQGNGQPARAFAEGALFGIDGHHARTHFGADDHLALRKGIRQSGKPFLDQATCSFLRV